MALSATVLAVAAVSAAPSAGAVGLNTGYYDTSAGAGQAYQTPAITTAGDTPVLLNDVDAASLAGVDVIAVSNPSNGDVGAEYLSRLADIEAAVRAGKVLVFHDRWVSGAAGYLPGGAGITAVRDFGDDANIDIVDNTTVVTNGPGGVLDNSSLDGGNSSSHGYVDQASLPPGGVVILSRTNPAHGVTVCWPLDAGAVIYSTIPLDFYQEGSGSVAAFADIYAPNVMAAGANGTCSGGGAPVTNVNRRPIAENDAASTPVGEAVDIDVLGNDRDPDGNFLTPRIVTQGAHGTVTLDVNVGRFLTYTPEPGFVGTDTFTYQAVDRDGAPSDPATVTVVVGGTPACAPDGPPAGAFDDVPAANVHAEAIDCLAWWGIVLGTGGNDYSPANPVTRAQMASFVERLLTEAGVEPSGEPADAFTDDDDSVHEAAINTLAALGVVKGTTPTTYSPGDHVTRAQAASMIVRAYELATGDPLPAGGDAFGDDDDSVHEDNINKGAAAGFIQGTTATTFAPGSDVRRDQMASFLRRVLDGLVAEGLATPPAA